MKKTALILSLLLLSLPVICWAGGGSPLPSPLLRTLYLDGRLSFEPVPEPTAGPTDANQVSVKVFDATNNALRINATLTPGGTHTPNDADQVFTSIFDATNNAVRVNCVLGCSGGSTPGGSNLQLQWNNAGTAFGGTATLTFNTSTGQTTATSQTGGTTPALFSTDNETGTADAYAPDAQFDTPANSRRCSFVASLEGGQDQIQVCWQPGPQGQIIFGSAVAASAISNSPFAKVIEQSGTAAHSIMRLYQQSTSATGTMLNFNNATAAGPGFNFWVSCPSASATDTSCASANNGTSLRGDSAFIMPSITTPGTNPPTGYFATYIDSSCTAGLATLTSGGTKTCLGTSSLTATQVGYGSSGGTISSDANFTRNNTTGAVSLQPLASQDAVPLTLAPSVGSPANDIFDIYKDSAKTTKAIWADASGNLNWLGNVLPLGSSGQSTQSIFRCYGSVSGGVDAAPCYGQLLDGLGNFQTNYFASQSRNGFFSVLGSNPGGDVAVGNAGLAPGGLDTLWTKGASGTAGLAQCPGASANLTIDCPSSAIDSIGVAVAVGTLTELRSVGTYTLNIPSSTVAVGDRLCTGTLSAGTYNVADVGSAQCVSATQIGYSMSAGSAQTTVLAQLELGNPAGGSIAWSAIGNPSGNLALTMTGDSTTFAWGSTNTNQWLWDTSGNPTMGLVSTTTAVTNSPTLTIQGSYQNAGTPTFLADNWTVIDVVGTGTNGTSTLTFAHSGSSGTTQVSLPQTVINTLLTGAIKAGAAASTLTVQSGLDTSNNAAQAALTVRGGDALTAGGSTSAGGNVIVRGGNNAATNTSSKAGSLFMEPGQSTGATQGIQALISSAAVEIKGATTTLWNLGCPSSTTAMTLVDCGASPGNWLGVEETINTNTVVYIYDGYTAVNASGAVTVGHTVCATTSAGVVTDSGGTTACALGSQVGIVRAVSGTWVLGDGTSFVASTTLPLIRIARD